MKQFAVWCTAILTLFTLSACDRNSQQSPLRTGFNAASTKLALIPDGYELGDAQFSSDGYDAAFIARKDGKAFVYHGDKRQGPYEDARELVFRTGSSDLAFIARNAGKEMVVVNGVEGAQNETIRQLFFGQDGRIVYSASRNDTSIVVAGKRDTHEIGLAQTAVVASEKGSQLAYIDHDNRTKKSKLQVCTIELTKCVAGNAYDFLALLKSDKLRSRIGCVAGKDGKMAVVTVEGTPSGPSEKESPWYDEIFNFAFSEDGKYLAFLARRGSTTFLVKGPVEIPYPGFDMTLDVVVSRTGRTLFTGVRKNNVFAFIDGKPIDGKYSEITSPSFSNDGAGYVFAAVIGSNNRVIVNGKQGPPFERAVTPHFSPDGSRIAYRARKNGERFVVIADTSGRTVREGRHFEAVWDAAFSPDGKYIGYGVKKMNELWWQTEKMDK